MFDGVPADQFHQFIASRASLPLNFPLHATAASFPSFDHFPSSHSQSHLLHPLHHPSPTHKDEDKEVHHSSYTISTNLELERERSISEAADPWSNDEVLALLRIRSSMENWFPADSVWEHVSRKLGELGFKRNAEKCKEKFEEESRYFNSINYNKNYRFFSELEEFYNGENTEDQVVTQKGNEKMEEKANGEEEDKIGKSLEEDSRNETTREVVKKSKSKKRKRHHRFEMLKCFCEDIVNKILTQQQELHDKLLGDMMKRDEENIAREEAWKKQEMDRINKEIETRANEQAIAGDRQAAIIEFLKKFTYGPENQCFGGRNEEQNPLTSPSLILDTQKTLEAPTSSALVLLHQNPSSCSTKNNPNVPTSITETLPLQNRTSTLDPNIPKVPTSQNPNSFNTQSNPFVQTSQNPNFAANEEKDHGKRWPRDEVLALINLRCSFYNSGEDKEGAKAPLWERISQGMLELGYKRSTKRCKEKWENINKYFRKTKDANKKRSLDSRTCPYFHQLSNLYKQGTLVAPSDIQGPENRSSSPENNHSTLLETRSRFPQGGSSDDANVHVAEGEKNMLQAPAFDFDF